MSHKLVKIFKSLSDQSRIDIIRYLLKRKEVSCQEISTKFPLSQPTLSHHFNKLIDSGILKVRKNGSQHYYSVAKAPLSNIGINVKKIINFR